MKLKSGSLKLPRTTNKYAYVFYATNDTYAISAMVFVHRLKSFQAAIDADIVLIHYPLTNDFRKQAKEMGIITVLVEPLPSAGHVNFIESLSKLRLFQLTCYERIVYVDADALPLRSLDFLFSIPMTKAIAAPMAYWEEKPIVCSALMVVSPSPQHWGRLMPRIQSALEQGVCDMEIVNTEFENEIVTLPFESFCLNSEWEDATKNGVFPDPLEARAKVAVVHFTALSKPWTYSTEEARRKRPNAHPIFFELWDEWRNTRDQLFRY
jgi:Alpha-N-acetylglucosamine transferase